MSFFKGFKGNKGRPAPSLEEFIKEVNDAQREQAKRGISGEAFATLWVLKQAGIPMGQTEKVAIEMAAVLKEYPHWHTSDEQSRHVRIRLYALLDQANIKGVPEVADKIMTIIKRR